MQAASPVDGNVAFLSVETRCALHTAAGTDAAKFEKAVKHGAIISDIVFALLSHIAIHVVRGDLLEEVDVIVGMELGHFAAGGRFGALFAMLANISRQI